MVPWIANSLNSIYLPPPVSLKLDVRVDFVPPAGSKYAALETYPISRDVLSFGERLNFEEVPVSLEQAVNGDVALFAREGRAQWTAKVYHRDSAEDDWVLAWSGRLQVKE